MLAIISCLRTALSKLDPRSCDIICRRYGLDGEVQNLGPLAANYGITAERIRQLEAKALRLMRRGMQRHLTDLVHMHGAEVWQKLAGDDDVLLAHHLWIRRRQLSPWLDLALELCEMRLEDILDRYAQRFGKGWVTPNWRLDEVATIWAGLEQRLARTALPCALVGLAPSEIAPMARAVLVLADFHLLGTYVARERPTPRTRRALRLHAILANSGKILQIVDLAGKYRAQTPADACTARDCEIVMEAQDHLFLKVTEGCWAALGPAGEAPDALEATRSEETPGENTELESLIEDESHSISRSLELALRSSGPSRISRLIERAPDFLPPGRSENSIGRVLSTDKDVFVRLLPGIYALPDQVPSPAQLLSAPPPYMFHEDQVSLYALARRAGEPWGTYPLWLPESEYLWCVWAKTRADNKLLESLLSVSQINAWPKTEDLNTWREVALRRGRFSLQFPYSPGALVPPRLDRVLAACLYVRQHGCLGWISGNRLLLQSAHAHRSAGLLAVLVALRIVTTDAEDWQGPHKPGPRLDEHLARLEGARVRTGQLDWDTDLGRELRADAVASPDVTGWVSRGLVQELFRCGTDAPNPEPNGTGEDS